MTTSSYGGVREKTLASHIFKIVKGAVFPCCTFHEGTHPWWLEAGF